MLDELRRQLTEEASLSSDVHQRVADEIARRRGGNRNAPAFQSGMGTNQYSDPSVTDTTLSVSDRFRAYEHASQEGQRRFDEIFRFFSPSGSMNVDDLRQGAAKLSVNLSDEQFTAAFAEPFTSLLSANETLAVKKRQNGGHGSHDSYGSPSQQSWDVKRFARWWTFSSSTAAVAIRAAYTIRQVKLAKQRADSSDRNGVAAVPWTRDRKVRANVTLGDVGSDFVAKSSVRFVALPTKVGEFADIVQDALDDAKSPPEDENNDAGSDAGSDSEGGGTGGEVTPATTFAVITARFPIVVGASDEAVTEAIELFRAAAGEFNAQDEFPAVAKIGVVDAADGSREFALSVFIRKNLLSGAIAENPYFDFLVKLQLLEDAGVFGVDGVVEPLFERIALGIDLGSCAAEALRHGSNSRIADQFSNARVSFQTSVSDLFFDVFETIKFWGKLEDSPPQMVKILHKFVAERVVNGIDGTFAFDHTTEAIDTVLDLYQDISFKTALEKLAPEDTADIHKVEGARETANAARTRLKTMLGVGQHSDFQASDVLGIGKIATLLGKEVESARISIFGGEAIHRAWFLHCLSFPEAANLGQPDATIVESALNVVGPHPLILKKGIRTTAFTYHADLIPNAVRAPNQLLVALVDASTISSTLADLTPLQAIAESGASPTFAGKLVVVLVVPSNADSDRIGRLREQIATIFDESSQIKTVEVAVFRLGLDFTSATAQMQTLSETLISTANLDDVDCRGDEDDPEAGQGDEDGSGKEIATTLLFAFRRLTTGPTAVTVATTDFIATLRLTNIPLLTILPETKEATQLAVAQAKANIESRKPAEPIETKHTPMDSDSEGDEMEDSDDTDDGEVEEEGDRTSVNRKKKQPQAESGGEADPVQTSPSESCDED